ncbi:PQQ-dependent sugar dehydrogenase [Conexibacter sp. JD483]|uniref:PQQ-dependent sugar dehydrogenase n=1 Tax=unclassified Conexibacter TaxID=2627773 RepID=UPI00272539CE|nr:MULTISPECIES: PQQ-dependent sugar dehydrogenase [unclassified Conexibacter]MDO8187598.1 PQQ-dependent sugar dehydrogenase [Conexibacter sp. CPCC 205706]MDO8201070.1 PQQ-dependent sugar dehydrogenase [Conexibacter sp. CPCC 205762]MDR9371825.1 PQQ-dependent sugar dehydrogenase [Conexibacter sp. JD483]
MRRLSKLLITAALAACALAGATAAAQADPRLQSIGPRFDTPVHVSGAPGDGERLYVVEKAGIVKVVKGGVASTFLDLRGVVDTAGEEGLLSIAFPPDFQTSRLFYVYFTERGGDNRIEELRAPTGDAADPASRRLVLHLPHPDGPTNHNGGQLQFTPDGLLWAAPGDGAQSANAQDLDSPLGKVLRLDPRGGVAGSYSVPADNPFAAAGGTRALVWAYGLRNPFRFSFDRSTGDLVIGDVGESTTEEIDWLPVSSGRGRGANLGWRTCEGSFAYGSRTTPCPLAGSTLPLLDLFHSDGYAALIAGYVVRDPSLPSLFGRVIWGDNAKPQLSSAVPGPGAAATVRESGLSIPGLTSFGEDAGGCLYATAGGGSVYRIVENSTAVPCAPAAPPGGGDGTTPPPPVGDGGGRTTTPGGARRAPARSAPVRGGLRATRAQRLLRNGGVVVRVRCAVACRATAGASFRSGRRTLQLRRVAARVRAGRTATLKARLTPSARRALSRALRRGAHPRVAVRVRLTAAGRAPTTLRTTIRPR